MCALHVLSQLSLLSNSFRLFCHYHVWPLKTRFVIQVTPMTEVLLIGGAWLHWVRPLLLAGLAAVGFATITPLVQVCVVGYCKLSAVLLRHC